MSPSEYHALELSIPRGKPDHILSQSQLTSYFKNPYVWLNGPYERKTDSMTFGSVLDALLLTPDEVDRLFVISPYPDFKTNEAQCFRDMVIMSEEAFAQAWVESPHETYGTKVAKAWKEEQQTKMPKATPLFAGKFESVRKKYAAVLKRAGGEIPPSMQLITGEDMREAERALVHFRETDFAWIFDHGISQHVLQWNLEGIPFKAMLDFVPPGDEDKIIIGNIPANDCLIDLKTTVDASEFGFRQSIRKFRYDIQAAIYLTGWNELNPDDPRDHFIWVALENRPPYACACYALSETTLGTAEHSEEWPYGWRHMLKCYQDSLDFNTFRDYNNGGPAWMNPWAPPKGY